MSYLTDFFKMVSDETRFRIIILLEQQELCVCQVCGILNLSQPKVSKHLSKLRDMRFVVDERKEKYIYYTLNLQDDVIRELIKNIINHIDKYPQFSKDSDRLIDKDTYLRHCKSKLYD